MNLTDEERKKHCGMKKPLFDDIMVMCIRAFHMFTESMNLADMSLFQMYFAGFLAGVTTVLTVFGWHNTCRDADCDRDCDNCELAMTMRIHFLAQSLRQEYDDKIRKENDEMMSDKKVDIKNKIL